MDEFAQQSAHIPGAPPAAFAMDHMRREMEQLQNAMPQTGSPGWAAEFDGGEQARMEAAFAGSQGPRMDNHPNISSQEFLSQMQSTNPHLADPMMGEDQRSRGMGMGGMGMNMGMGGMGMSSMTMNGLGMGGMGMMRPAYNPMAMQQPQPSEATTQDKGKGRMVELDDENWEAQFAEIDAAGNQATDEEANAAVEAELNELDRSVPTTTSTTKQNQSILIIQHIQLKVCVF